jgi:DNA polymerase-3 subunit epsilon
VAPGWLPLLALDVETTGLHADERVLSIGWASVDGRGVVLAGARYRVVRPEEDQAVGFSATVHGPTDDEVAAGVPLADAVAELLADLAGRVLLVHFARIETEFLGRACKRLWGAGLPSDAVACAELYLAQTAELADGRPMVLRRLLAR